MFKTTVVCIYLAPLVTRYANRILTGTLSFGTARIAGRLPLFWGRAPLAFWTESPLNGLHSR